MNLLETRLAATITNALSRLLRATEMRETLEDGPWQAMIEMAIEDLRAGQKEIAATLRYREARRSRPYSNKGTQDQGKD